jgi:hypothetical protein
VNLTTVVYCAASAELWSFFPSSGRRSVFPFPSEGADNPSLQQGKWGLCGAMFLLW